MMKRSSSISSRTTSSSNKKGGSILNNNNSGRRRIISLNRLIALGLLEVSLFHLYFWEYTLFMFDYSSSLSSIHGEAHNHNNDNNKNKMNQQQQQDFGNFDLDTMEMIDIVQMHSKSDYQFPLFDSFHIPTGSTIAPESSSSNNNNTTTTNSSGNNDRMGVEKTFRVLEKLGISRDSLEKNEFQDMPPWSQIIENFGGGSSISSGNDNGDDDDDERQPVILGLERCQAYRERVPPSKRTIGPAGLFSSGTNIIWNLLSQNCLPPKEMKHKSQRAFTLYQVPW